MVSGKLDLQKRQHRERAQPLKRQKLGLLEKHADYVKRARDFHSKEDRIKKLREKASGKNADEFYFGMIRSKTIKGVHVQSRGNAVMSDDLVKVLKTQDAGYIRTQRSVEQGKVDKLQRELDTLLDTTPASVAKPEEDFDEMEMGWSDDEPSTSAPKRNHVIFSSDLQAVRTTKDAASLLPPRRSLVEVAVSTLGRNKPSRKSEKGKGKEIEVDVDAEAADARERDEATATHRTKVTQELKARQARLAALTLALRELEMQRLLMGKGAKKSIVAKKGAHAATGGDDDWNDGNGGTSFDDAPEAAVGIATGARTWKWKSERKR